ncbi:MAG: adenylyl-sulfate kinase [Anaerolineae bacterium]|nr:adenylyl-sulfate kinase [Anaerolineae bacterium]
MKPAYPGFVLWLTGLPASGKSSLALAIKEELENEHIHTIILDANDLRQLLTPDPQYTDYERQWLYRAITGLATMLACNGDNVIIAATANRRIYRETARRQIQRFAEVYVHCPLGICQERDEKGQFLRNEENGADSVPGIGVAYERPFAPEVTVETITQSPRRAAESVITTLKLEKIILEPNHLCLQS